METEIKVTAYDITADENRAKTFAVCFEVDDKLYMKRQTITDIEDIIINSIAARIKQDRDYLIEWANLPGKVIGKIRIIPAIDYQPQNK